MKLRNSIATPTRDGMATSFSWPRCQVITISLQTGFPAPAPEHAQQGDDVGHLDERAGDDHDQGGLLAEGRGRERQGRGDVARARGEEVGDGWVVSIL